MARLTGEERHPGHAHVTPHRTASRHVHFTQHNSHSRLAAINVSLSGSVWLVIVAALLAANLPFVNHRWLVVGPVARPRKPLAGRLAELVLAYFVVGALALLLERRAGQIAPQGWEFYAVTGTLFLTLAFPGFVYRYLMRRHG